jgi:hypothetical protein
MEKVSPFRLALFGCSPNHKIRFGVASSIATIMSSPENTDISISRKTQPPIITLQPYISTHIQT